jgi:hypothetical protein
MSDKKDPGTSMVSLEMKPLDKALVPETGYHELVLVENERKEARREFFKATGLTVGSVAIGALGLFVSALIPLASPYFFLAALLMSGGVVGGIAGAMYSTMSLFRLVRANRMRSLPSGENESLACMEGVAHALIEAWNRRAKSWEEGWRLLEQEERDLFALADRCVTKKSRRGLVRRIEYVRKEKRKHLRVRAKLEVERDRIMAGIASIRKRLPPPKEPFFLRDGGGDPS